MSEADVERAKGFPTTTAAEWAALVDEIRDIAGLEIGDDIVDWARRAAHRLDRTSADEGGRERARKEIRKVLGYSDLKPSTAEPLRRALAALDEGGN